MAKAERPRIRSHRDLIIWQRSMELVNAIYNLTEPFPTQEQYGLTAQMRRAAVSIPSNIAEGVGRHTTRDLLRFMGIARGSLFEVDTCCDISEMRRYASGPEVERARLLIQEVGRMNTALCAALRRRLRTNH
jgi:four helix bundle protein